MMNLRHPIPKRLKDKVKAKFDGRCGYCGQKPDKLCIDHIHPVARAHFLKAEGKNVNNIENLMPACFSCNNYKLSFDLEDFRNELTQQVHRAREHSLNFRLAERFGLIQVIDKPIQFYFESLKASNEGDKSL